MRRMSRESGLRPGAADYQLVQAGLVVAFGLMQHSLALAVIEWTVWDGLSNLRITYPSSTSRLRPPRGWLSLIV